MSFNQDIPEHLITDYERSFNLDILIRRELIRDYENAIKSLPKDLLAVQKAQKEITKLEGEIRRRESAVLYPIIKFIEVLNPCPKKTDHEAKISKINDLNGYKPRETHNKIEPPQHDFIFENKPITNQPKETKQSETIPINPSKEARTSEQELKSTQASQTTEEKESENQKIHNIVFIKPAAESVNFSKVITKIRELLVNKMISTNIEIIDPKELSKKKISPKTISFSFYLSKPTNNLNELNQQQATFRKNFNGNCVLVVLNRYPELETFNQLQESGYKSLNGEMKKTLIIAQCALRTVDQPFANEEEIKDMAEKIEKVYEQYISNAN